MGSVDVDVEVVIVEEENIQSSRLKTSLYQAGVFMSSSMFVVEVVLVVEVLVLE